MRTYTTIKALLYMLVTTMALAVHASDGCKDGWQKGYYGQLREVDCACPCEVYAQNEYGMCSRCRHYRRPTEYS